jgi:hypothetical protein
LVRQELFFEIQLAGKILVALLMLQSAGGDELLQLGERSVARLPSFTQGVKVDSDNDVLRHALRLHS